MQVLPLEKNPYLVNTVKESRRKEQVGKQGKCKASLNILWPAVQT